MRILLISGNQEQYGRIRGLLAGQDGAREELVCTPTMPQALEALAQHHVDVVVVNLDPPGELGLESLDQLRRRAATVPVVALTTGGDEVAAQAVQRGAQDALTPNELSATVLARTLHYAVERKQAEEQLALSRKLESIGQLAAGIAHEINTPVQYIGDSVHFLRDCFGDFLRLVERYHALRKSVSEGRADAVLALQCAELEQEADLEFLRSEVPRAFQRTLDGIERVAHVVRAMKEFSYPNRKEKVAAQLNQAVQDALTVARNEYKYVAEVQTDLAELPPVYCHIGDIHQVLLNLIVNAAHAISQATAETERRGLIGITTRLEGDQVAVSISDNGCGIAKEHGSRVFDPFFTTKRPGKGTGQGLAIAYSIVVDKHGGTLSYESEPGQGTTFVIRLPINGATAGRPQEAA